MYLKNKFRKIEEENEDSETDVSSIKNLGKLNTFKSNDSIENKVKPQERLTKVSYYDDIKNSPKFEAYKTNVKQNYENNNLNKNTCKNYPNPSKILYKKIIDVAINMNKNSSNLDSSNEYFKWTNSLLKSQYGLHYFNNKNLNVKVIKQSIFMLLEKPTGNWALIHRLFIVTLILVSILFAEFITIKTIKTWSENILFYIELIVTIYFFVEYCLRVWSSDCLQKYRGIKGKFDFMTRPIMIIEMLAFIFGVILIIGSSHTRKFSDTENYNIYYGPMALTILRFLQLVRLVCIDRKASTWLILFYVCKKHKFELISR